MDVVNVTTPHSRKLTISIYKLEERITSCFKRNKVGEMCLLFGFEILQFLLTVCDRQKFHFHEFKIVLALTIVVLEILECYG